MMLDHMVNQQAQIVTLREVVQVAGGSAKPPEAGRAKSAASRKAGK